jgi:hypothetical protein
MKNGIAVALAAAAGLGMGVLVGCGVELPDDEGGAGPVCHRDEDCVPDACCGRATGAVHVSLAPDCRGVTCDGTCPPNLVDTIECGCGIPVCRDGQCQGAFTSNDQCG